MASDLSFNIVALDQASKTLDEVAGRLELVSMQLARIDGKDATANVNVKTDESQKALDSFTNRFALMTSAIVAASPLAGAAILGGIGASFIGVAALAVKSNADVQASYQNLWTGVVQTAQQGAAPLVANFVASANQMDATATKLGPDLQRAFSYAGPDLVALTRGVDDFATNAMPGITTAIGNSLPVFQGIATAAGTLGQALGTALTSASQHATEYGAVVSSMGQIVGTVLTGAVSLVNLIAQAWAQNAGPIVADVQQIIGVVTDLAGGAMPSLSGAVTVVAGAIHEVLSVLGPLAPLLGTVGGVALVAFAAFKTADLVTAGVKSLADGVVGLAGNVEAGAARSAAYIASLQGVEVEASAAASSVAAAGAATATAGTEMGIGLSALAGPIGIIAAIAAGALALGAAFIHTGSDTIQLSGNMDGLTAALERSHGAFDQATQDALKADPDFKKVADSVRGFGISSNDLATALNAGGGSVDGLRQRLQAIIEKHTTYQQMTTGSGEATGELSAVTDDAGGAAQKALDAFNGLVGEYNSSAAAAAASARAASDHAAAVANSTQYQQTAAGIASILGVDLTTVTFGYRSIIGAAGAAGTSVAAASEQFAKNQLAVAQAATALQDHFAQADRQVVQASQSVASAQHSQAQAAQSVADAEHQVTQAERALVDAHNGVESAEHSLEQAHRSVDDALAGVTTAEQNYQKSLESERAAQVAVNRAREQAIQDLKDLHLQMQDQVLTEEQARVKLFDAQTTAASSGVTLQNAQAIAGQQVNATNEAQIKVAFDLISAQNALNNALNNGDKLRKQVTAADQAGVNGAPGVISAQNALRNAQDQVSSAAAAVTKAHQAVRDAEYQVSQAELGLQKAHQAVTDAGYQLQKAHQSVRDAQYQQRQASIQLHNATLQLRDAQDDARRSLDLHTAAGQQNAQMVLQLWDSITKMGLPIQQQYRQAIDEVATSFGISRDQAQSYLQQLGLIPKDFQYSVTAISQVDLNNFNNWLGGVLKTGGYAMDSRNVQKSIGNTGYASGGPISGFGTGTSDDVPLWGSAGEWIFDKGTVDFYGPSTMKAMQQRKVPRGGDGAALIPGYASGGAVGVAQANFIGGALGAGYMAMGNALGVMGFPPPPPLPKYVPPAFGSFAGSAVPASRAGNRQTVLDTWVQFGWVSPAEIAATDYLLMRESGYNNLAQNPTSTAFGMFQFLDSTWAGYGVPKTADPALQALAGGRYIASRYGDPIGAAAHERANNWYAAGGLIRKPQGFDNGGGLQPGLTAVYNGTGKVENVRTAAQEDALLSEVKKLGKGGNTYVLNVYEAGNNEIDLKAQFQRMEIAAGIL